MDVEEKKSIMFNFIPPDHKKADTSITYLYPGMSLRHVMPIADPEGKQLKLAVRDIQHYFFNVWASLHPNCDYYTLHSDPVVIGKNTDYGPSIIRLTYTDPTTEKEFIVLKNIEILEEGVYLDYVRKEIINEKVYNATECQTAHHNDKVVDWQDSVDSEFSFDYSTTTTDFDDIDFDDIDWDAFE